MNFKKTSHFLFWATSLILFAGCDDAKAPKRNPVTNPTGGPEQIGGGGGGGGGAELAAQCASKNQDVASSGKECVAKQSGDPLAKLKAKCVAENKVVNAEKTNCISEADAFVALEAQCKLDKKEVAANKTECASTPIPPEVLALEAKCKTENKVISADKKSCVESTATTKPGETKPGETKPPPVADPGATGSVITSLFTTFAISPDPTKKNCDIPKGSKVTLAAAPTQSTKNEKQWSGKLKGIVSKDDKVIACPLTDVYFIANQFKQQ